MGKSYYLINSFQCPNWMDDLCLLLSGTEFQIFYATFRKTIGDMNKRGISPEDRKAGITYHEFQKLTGLSRSTISTSLKTLVEYKILLPVPGPITRKKRHGSDSVGQQYRLNVVMTCNTQHGKATQVHLSERLMDFEGLRRRMSEKHDKKCQDTCQARAEKTVKKDMIHEQYQSVEQTVNLNDQSVKQTDNNLKRPEKSDQPASPKPKRITLGENQSENPHHTALDPITGEQHKPVCECVSGQQTIFQYLEQTLQEDTRVQAHPPIQPYQIIFEHVMTLRQITASQLQQLITGILADTHIKNPIGALRSPDTFQTEQYLFTEPEPQPVAGIRQGDVWQQTLNVLEGQVHPSGFNTWLRPTHLLGIEDRIVRISVPDEVFTYWLGENYSAVMTAALTAELGYEPRLEFVVQAETPHQSKRI
jgi:DNA-binding transcriptional regulator GbsR (MarR family)